SRRLINCEDDRMKLMSQGRCRRAVTPLRSGPTLTPWPNVWQPVQRDRKTAPACDAVAGESAQPFDDRTIVMANMHTVLVPKALFLDKRTAICNSPPTHWIGNTN